MSFRDRLRRMRREGAGLPVADAADSASIESGNQPPKEDSGEPRELQPFEGPGGPGLARTTLFAVDYLHGDAALDEVRAADMEDLVLLTGDGALGAMDLEQTIYLDTETTGLSGGAGTYVFMIGLGRFVSTDAGPRFEVWQGFLPGPEGEAALLGECARRLRAGSGVVSFFGKSFDRHRLEDKMALCHVPAPFEELPHLDLYHPCRRLYRGAYGDGRLKTMEAELCGVQREDDLPGSLAPEAWFDYLAKRAHRLEGVFRHNLDDVLSLVTLASHLGCAQRERRPDGRELAGHPATRALGLSRSLASRRDRSGAIRWLELAVERGAGPARELLRERADLLRLNHQVPEAIQAYRELLEGPADRQSVPGWLELAKLFEHHGSGAGSEGLTGALQCCRNAEALLERHHTGPEFARLSRDLRKRSIRLMAKTKEGGRP